MNKILRKKWLKLPLVLIAIVASGDLIAVFLTHGKSEDVRIVSLENPVAYVKTDQIK